MTVLAGVFEVECGGLCTGMTMFKLESALRVGCNEVFLRLSGDLLKLV